jgi:ATP dependent DNA ligase domain
VRSCLIDGEVVCCDERGVGAFHVLRRRRNEPQAFLYTFDLLELDGTDMRREPIEVRKATLASILRKSRQGVRLNEHLEHPEGEVVFRHACKLGLEVPACLQTRAREGSCLSASGRATGPAASRIGSSSRRSIELRACQGRLVGRWSVNTL